MSYRSIKRVLGESSLARKLRLLFGVVLFVLIFASFWWASRAAEELVYDGNRRVGREYVRIAINDIHIKKWSFEKDEREHVGSLDYLMRILDTSPHDNYQTHVILPQGLEVNPYNLDPPEDEVEQEMHDQWRRDGQLLKQPEVEEEANRWRYRERRLQDNYFYYQPVFATKLECVECHGASGKVPNPNLKVGDLMGIVRVKIPNHDSAKAMFRTRVVLFSIAIITVFLAMVALYFIVRYVLTKPLTHLREVSNDIARGDLQRRAEINTGDEFEQLATSFNRMVRHLTEAQQKLQHANVDLDTKVDQLAQANMRLYQMNRLKGDFLATVSHELRTPLNSILGFSDVLESIDALDDKQRRYVENIRRSGRMLLEMINDILDLAKIESGKMNVNLTDFSIHTVIAAQCDMARPLTEKRNIDLTPEVDPDLPQIHQDQAKVQQILSNLLSNAIKFTPEGGRITVSARRMDDDRLELVVADTGIGISEEDQQVIFEKFRQGTTVLGEGDAITREYSGTGLGLSIVKELCKLLGGEVTVESELGAGSTFTVHLPWQKTERPLQETELDEQLDQMTRLSPPDSLSELTTSSDGDSSGKGSSNAGAADAATAPYPETV